MASLDSSRKQESRMALRLDPCHGLPLKGHEDIATERALEPAKGFGRNLRPAVAIDKTDGQRH